MNKVAPIFFLAVMMMFFSSCSIYNKFKMNDTVFYSDNINKSIHNLEVMQRWVEEDYQAGLIPENIANNYFLVLENTKMDLYKKKKKLQRYILASDF